MREVKHLVARIDVSRNSVLKVDEIKKFIDCLKLMGYNAFGLYTEDLYEMPEYPMFGYMRGKYSKQDLKELVAYGEKQGMAYVPCVEVLGHIEHIFRWNDFNDVRDNRDILLADEPKTYELIETMIKTMREICKTDLIALGCDETWSLGLGKYLKKHGYTNPSEIFRKHMEKCVDIAHKYGFTPLLSNDMFFRFAGEQYTNDPDIITPEIAALFPKNAIMGYWDYFSKRETVENMLTACERFGSPVGFNCSVLSWTGFTPHNYRAFASFNESIPPCVEHDIQYHTVSFWGDDGGECSVWACLPAWLYAAEFIKGQTDVEKIKQKFFDIFGISFDDFCKLDYPADFTGQPDRFNSVKPALYNDPFMGICDDLMVKEDEVKTRFAKYAKELDALKDAPRFGYLFDYSAKLCRVLELKYDLGKRTRAAYKAKDKTALQSVIADYAETYDRLCEFYKSFKYVWLKERKGNGFEVQAIRLGGLKQRLLDCKERLEAFLNGELDRIEELDEDMIPIPDVNDTHNFKINHYGKIVSVNTLTHYNFYGNDNFI